jgi:hypothetical protein
MASFRHYPRLEKCSFGEDNLTNIACRALPSPPYREPVLQARLALFAVSQRTGGHHLRRRRVSMYFVCTNLTDQRANPCRNQARELAQCLQRSTLCLLRQCRHNSRIRCLQVGFKHFS